MNQYDKWSPDIIYPLDKVIQKDTHPMIPPHVRFKSSYAHKNNCGMISLKLIESQGRKKYYPACNFGSKTDCNISELEDEVYEEVMNEYYDKY